MALYVKVSVISAVDGTVQSANLVDAGRLAGRELPTMSRARAAFLSAGYPKTFPVVRDIDREVAALNRLISISKTARVQAVGSVYSDLLSAGEQFATDATDDICT